MRNYHRMILAACCGMLVQLPLAHADELKVSASAVSLSAGAQAKVTVSGAKGTVRVASASTSIATAAYAGNTITITGVASGQTKVNVSDREHKVTVAVTVTGATAPPPPGTSTLPWRVLASNDLGMHCADLDYQIFSILPPFNVVRAQVVQTGTSTAKPRLLSGADADVSYRATSSSVDPAGAGSINTTSNLAPVGTKSNFWASATLPNGSAATLGGLAYRSLYPGAVLDLFAPIPVETGLPVPDPVKLPALAPAQQKMPSPGNIPQKFARFDASVPFFAGFPFGTVVTNANWFAADGIPILPVDDAGRTNPYPLMRVQAVAKGADPTKAANIKASLDIVLPVASEADCRNCHNGVDGVATVFAKVTKYANGAPWPIALEGSAPGPDKVNNAAKINILRLHDAKWGTRYTSSATGAATPCAAGTEASCLDRRRAIQCSQCHYSPALDLAHVGPVDEPAVGVDGRQQTRHISMSRAMHFTHGQYADLFPTMPLPKSAGRTLAVQTAILDQTCYQCHPGKETKCLRGAMGAGGVVCQDCHGDMKQVGNDFTAGFPGGTGADLTKRVPWAVEPKCQSCHVGDAKSVTAMNRADHIVAADGIRNLLAFTKSSATAASVKLIDAPASRFAENQKLYRLSIGHGGVACQGCHGGTHAEWPNPNPNANDNIAALQLQGHSGTLVECTTCHAAGSLGLTLNGPHGMHPVNDTNWTANHKQLAEKNRDSCRTCHGLHGEGTPLSRVAATRTLRADDDGNKTITLQRGAPVRCDACHENKL
ncbi:MAG: cytochrome C [Betaproteobacteria bacterium]